MSKLIILLLVTQVLTLTVHGNDENPLLDLASSFLQNMGDGNSNSDGLSAIGSIVGSLMEGDNAKNLGALFGQNGGDVLSGLGGLLGGGGGGNQNGQIDPAMIGTMLNMFSQMTQNNQNQEGTRQKRESKKDNGIDLEGIMNLASSFMGNKNSGNNNLLPAILSTISTFTNAANTKETEHKEHAGFVPPFLEKLHLYWDVFINSELGRTIWEKSGLKKSMKLFMGPDGKLDFEVAYKNFENQSFRRHWIKYAAKYLTDIFVSVSKPENYQKYLISGQILLNTFLDSQGLPATAHFSIKRPEQTITNMINIVLKQKMDIDTDVSSYVKPALSSLKETVKLAQTASQSFTNKKEYNALIDKMTDGLNMDVIEPVMRVYRAYRHSLEAPHCQEHLMCIVNRGVTSQTGESMARTVKDSLTKVSSMVASVALSFNNGKGFWDLYKAIQADVNCEKAYPADCASFHEHEQKVTTETYHSEL